MTGFGSARQSWAPPKQADSGGMAAKNEQSARSGGGTMPNGRGSGVSLPGIDHHSVLLLPPKFRPCSGRDILVNVATRRVAGLY